MDEYNTNTDNNMNRNTGATFHANGDGTWGQSNAGNFNGASGSTGNSSTGNSSYGNASYGNSSYGNNSYGNNSYGSSSYGNNQNGGTYYQQTAYGQQTYNGYNPYMKEKKPKKAKNPNRFSLKLGKAVAIALVFGLVAGSAFTGINYGLSKVLGTKALVESDKNVGSGIAISNTGINSDAGKELTDVSGLVEEAMKSCVAITNTFTYQTQGYFGFGGGTREATSAGSGVILSQDDKYLYIASNNHVVENANALTVQFADGATVPAEIKGTDPSTDLAVIKVEMDKISEETAKTIKTATVGNAENLKVGNACIAIGNALGYGQSVTTGVVSALDRSITAGSDSSNETTTYSGLIQTDAAINPGNSGGALLNAAGEVIGINSAKYSDTSVEGVGYAISMKDALPILEQLITKEKVDEARAGYLGIQGYDVSEDVAKTYGMPEGVYIYQALAGSGAEKAGIEAGDIIVGINDKTIKTMKALQGELAYSAAGDTVKITVAKRTQNYETIEVDVVLTSKTN